MATTEDFYTGNASTTSFGYSFPILQNSDLKVELDGVLKTENTSGTNNDYSISGTNVVFNSAPGSSVDIHIYRLTNVDSAKAVFAAGSSIRAGDLNNNVDQSLYANQEQQQKIRTADVRDNAITSAKIADGAVTQTKLAINSVQTTRIVDNAVTTGKIANENVTTAKLANEAVTTAKLANDAVTSAKLADNSVDSEHIVADAVGNSELAPNSVSGTEMQNASISTGHIVDGAVTTAKIAADAVTNAKIADDSIDSEHYVDGSIDTAHIADAQITTAKIADGAITDAKIQGGSLDNRYYTKTLSDARYFNVNTGDTIKDGDTFPDNDTTIATTAAINDRIIDLVDDVGGFVPIANETSFPTANPDVNNGAGTIVSVSAASTNLAPSGTTVTIANGRGSGLPVVITGVSATIPSGFGFLVETTTTAHTYTFHRLSPKATEVTTVAGKAVEIGRLGTADAVADMAILGTTDVVADMNTLAVSDVISDMNLLATSDVISDMNTLAVTSVINDMDTVAGISSNVTTVAGIHGNVTTVAGISGNVTTVANNNSNITTVANANSNINTLAGISSNITTVANNVTNVDNFANRYRISGSAPTSSLDVGDLYFDTSSNELRVYNGSAWQGGVTATGNLAGLGANSFTGNQTIQNSAPTLFLTDTSNNPDYYIQNHDGVLKFHDSTNSTNRLVIHTDGHLEIGGNTDFGAGIDVTGNITLTGNVDGRDVAADGNKLDGIATGATAFANVVEDTTPQLGGDLDVQSSKITTATSNGNVKIEPNGTGVVEIRGAGGNDGTLQLNCSAQSHGIKLKSPPHSAAQSYTLTFPSSLTANGVLTTNGSGTLTAGLLATANIAAEAVTSAKIQNGAITNAKLADDAVGIDEIADNAVRSQHINADAVTTAKIVSGAVTNTKIATNAVGTTSIAADAITNALIADNAVENANIANNAVTTAKIADDAVDADKLANTSVTAGSYGSATAIPAITVDAQGRITAASTNTVNTTTNLSTSTGGSSVTINSSTGNNATISEATGSAAGVMTVAHHDKLDGIASSANNYSHPNHSGEVTSSGDGAMTIANNVVDEANLKISNSPQDGYMLTAQSGNTGGLTWAPAAAGATGASNDEIFWENGTNVTANYTITNGKNAGSFGPITINSGVTVTVGAGETWTVV